MRSVAVIAAATMVALGLLEGTALAITLIVLASVITVADNGLAFTSVAEIGGPYWSGRAMGTQNTGQFLMAAASPPAIGAIITGHGYAWAFGLVAVFPLARDPARSGPRRGGCGHRISAQFLNIRGKRWDDSRHRFGLGVEMQKTYLVVARLIAILIVVQAMAIVFVVSGLFHWIDGGATLDKSVVDSWDDNPPTFQGSFGAFIHFFLVGVVLIPLSGLILLIVSFFAKIPRGVRACRGGRRVDHRPVRRGGHLEQRTVGRADSRPERVHPAWPRSGSGEGSQDGDLRAGTCTCGLERSSDQRTQTAPRRPGGHGRRAAAAGLVLATKPPAVDVLRDGHGVRRPRRWRSHSESPVSSRDQRRGPGGDRVGPADVSVDLVARKQKIELASGREIDGYTLNGKTPGPTIKATVGQLVEVRLRNESVKSGVTLHWHGVDVPNAEDGVAGVTQDAVEVGGTHTYRFVVDQVGTYWYHSHQLSHAQVIGGLFGALVVEPREGVPEDQDLLAVSHTYDGTRTLNGAEGVTRVAADPGERVRVRVINTDNGTMQVWATDPYRVVAVDGHDLNGPTAVEGRHLSVPAGGRADLEVTVPSSGAARVQVAAATAFVIGPGHCRDAGPPPAADAGSGSADLRQAGRTADGGAHARSRL